MKVCGIYLITVQRPENWSLYYVGQSSDVKTRIRMHFSALRSNRHANKYMQRAWEKYGASNFRWELLEECEADHLDELEQWWIDEMLESNLCLNIANFVSCVWRGVSFSDEHKRKIAAAHTGVNHYNYGKSLSAEHRQKISAGGKGKTRSEKTRTAISKANRGEKNSMFGKVGDLNPRSKAVVARSISTGTEIFFQSATIAEKYGFDQASISRCCSGKTRFHKGYIWRFATPQDRALPLPVSPILPLGSDRQLPLELCSGQAWQG